MSAQIANQLAARRRASGWSQAELAQRAGVSRAAISAIELERLVPSVAAALALASALDCTVEELFSPANATAGMAWAWQPTSFPARYWAAEVAGRTLLYPAESSPAGLVAHDGLASSPIAKMTEPAIARQTLVLACCDPAAGLLASEFQRLTGFRMLVLVRSSRQALQLLNTGLVHIAGVHLSCVSERGGNATAIQAGEMPTPLSLVHIARWQEGIAHSAGLKLQTTRDATRPSLRWVGRDPGSGARRCQDEILGDRKSPRRTARDHRGIVEAIRNGWGDVGVCVRLASAEAQLDFLPVWEENYDLCFSSDAAADPRIKALLSVIRSQEYRRLLSELPGYRLHNTGEIETVETRG